MKPGDLLAGKYRLERKIGEGAMGEVWVAENAATHGKFAIKLIIPQQQEQRTEDLRVRMAREAKNCGKLRHRNIVQIHDVGATPSGDPFLVMELLRGQTLADLLKQKRRLEPSLAARIAAEVASGLAVAHDAHVIHRDLKPANIFLHEEGGLPEGEFVSKILDFGVAKSTDGTDVSQTQEGIAVGSLAYMSPEQVSARRELDGRADIWALGIVLFEMLTGGRPFTGSQLDVSRQILMSAVNPVPAPSSRVPRIPVELDAIVTRCTAPKREDRYASAHEIAQALFLIAETSRSAKIPSSISGSVPSAPYSSPQRSSTPLPMAAVATPTDAPTTPLGPPPNAGAYPRAPMPSTPYEELPALDGTVPMSPEMVAQARAKRVGPPPSQSGVPQGQTATGTEIIDPKKLLASPNPNWRKEFEEDRARRQSSAQLPLVPLPSDAPPMPTTMMAPPSMQAPQSAQVPAAMPTLASPQYVPSPDPTGTTSSAGALSQPSAPRIAVPDSLRQGAPPTSQVKPQKKSSPMLLVAALMTLAALATGVAILVMKSSQAEGGGEPPKQASQEETSVVSASAAPAPPAPPKQQNEAAPDENLPRPPVTAEPSTPPAPSATTTTTATTTPKSTSAPPPGKAPAGTKPPCKRLPGLFNNCK